MNSGWQLGSSLAGGEGEQVDQHAEEEAAGGRQEDDTGLFPTPINGFLDFNGYDASDGEDDEGEHAEARCD